MNENSNSQISLCGHNEKVAKMNNIQPQMNMIMDPWPPQHTAIGMQRNENTYMNSRIDVSVVSNAAGNGDDNVGVGTLLPLHRPGHRGIGVMPQSHKVSSSSDTKKQGKHDAHQVDRVDTMDTIKGHSPSPLAGMSIPADLSNPSSLSETSKNGSARRTKQPSKASAKAATRDFVRHGGDDDDDASNITSITTELRKAAKKTIRHAKSKRAIHALVPLEVKEAMLEKEFPHVRGTRQRNQKSASGAGDGGGSVANSMKATKSVDSFLALSRAEQSSVNELSTALDRAYDEREFDTVDYDNCVQTMSPEEMLHLRNATYSYEKQRVITMMEHLSDQMQAFHEVLEENQTLSQEIDELKEEKDAKIHDLETTLIEMKLNLAMCQSREDHHTMSMTKLELDLKKGAEENLELRQKLGISPNEQQRPDGETEEQLKAAGGRLNSHLLTKSMSSAEDPNINIRSGETPKRKNPLLTRSWFGNGRGQGCLGGAFLDKSHKRDASYTSPIKSPEDANANPNNAGPRSPKAVVPTRSHSFIDPKKAREQRALAASKESNFMPWNCSEKSDDEGPMIGHDERSKKTPVIKQPIRSRSFVDPKKARKAKLNELVIGSDLIVPLSTNADGDVGFDSRSTFLSNITDITFEGDGDTIGERDADNRTTDVDVDRTIANEIKKTLIKDALAAASGKSKNSSSGDENGTKLPSVVSGGSFAGLDGRSFAGSELTFEPAKPQMQKMLSLRGAGFRQSFKLERPHPPAGQSSRLNFQQPMGLREVRQGREQLQHSMSLRGITPPERHQPQLHSSMRLQLQRGDDHQHEDEASRPQPRLRQRNKGKNSSAGDAHLAFC